jgi:hypothetical protein
VCSSDLKQLDVLHDLNIKVSGIQTSITDLSLKVVKLETAMKLQAKQIILTDARVMTLEKKVSTLTTELDYVKNQLLRHEITGKKINLVFHGIPEVGNNDRANCISLVKEVIQVKMEMDTEGLNIGKCYRLGVASKKQKHPRPRAILVGFASLQDREKVWAAKSKLKGEKIYIAPDLPKQVESRRQKMLPTYRKAKSMGKYQKITFLNDDRLSIDKKIYTIDNISELPEDLNPELDATQSKDGVTIFFTRFSKLSNHYTKAPFTMGPVKYSSTEQFYFAIKAREMGDVSKLGQIMEEEDPAKILTLGHQCKNNNNINWDAMQYGIMKDGCVAKFDQNVHCKEALLATGKDKLGEASASNEYWGLGMSLFNKDRFDVQKWSNNAMGQILSEIRDSYNA